MARTNESKDGIRKSERPRKKKKGRGKRSNADRYEFVGGSVLVHDGIPAEEATRIPRDMFQPGPVGDYYYANQHLLEFDMTFED